MTVGRHLQEYSNLRRQFRKNESATQEEVDNATALLTEAMDNLEPVKRRTGKRS